MRAAPTAPGAPRYRCNCGETFAGTLDGAWDAKLHVEDLGHRLRSEPPPGLVGFAGVAG